MGKGSWRRPNGPAFDTNYCDNFPNSRGCERERVAQAALDAEQQAKEERRERAEFHSQRMEERAKRLIALTLDELRTLVFETSVAYSEQLVSHLRDSYGTAHIQNAEWSRAAALKNALTRLGYDRESELIGGAA